MPPKSYVGITGFENAGQVGSVRAALPLDRLLMVGCCMRGHPRRWAPDRWPNRCPRPLRLATIFRPHKNVLNMLHFTPLVECDLYEHLCMAHDAAGPHLHGIQLNTPWPRIRALTRYRERHPGAILTIALQEEALAMFNWDPRTIAIAIALYQGMTDYVLVDPSAGCGKELDVEFIRACYRAIFARAPEIGLVAAGGLCAENVEEKLGELLEEFSLSTDAESKLRDFPDDRLNIEEAIRYAKTTDALMRKPEVLHQKL